jgi:hypothetical protein
MKVVHLFHDVEGGVKQYIQEFTKLTKTDAVHVNKLFSGGDMAGDIFNIHSLIPVEDIGWSIIIFAKFLKRYGIKIFLTIHDYYFLFSASVKGSDAASQGFTTEHAKQFPPHEFMKFSTLELFSLCDCIIMPTPSVYNNYKKFLDNSLDSFPVHVVPHCDIPVRMENLWINPVVKDIIRIACVGKKGQDMLKQVEDILQHVPWIQFVKIENYKNEELIDRLHKCHVILWPSRLEETYCYALTYLINSGLPIVYIRRGAFADRLPEKHERFFGCTDPENILKSLEEAIMYVKGNQCKKDYIDQGNEPVLNEWYRKTYNVA